MPPFDPRKPTVILRDCATYDPERIARIVGDGLSTLDLTPFGRTLVKPNCVAAGDLFPHAHTRPEFVEGVLRALGARGRATIESLAVGERCGITIPTRFAFSEARYPEAARRAARAIGRRVALQHFEEFPQVEVPLYHEGRLRDSIFTPEPVARADFFVNCPKFKAHPWTTVTFSMKNYIGIQDDRHRLIDHDWALDRKVADLQAIVQPQFVAVDAIVAGEGRMLTPRPRALGLVIMGNNQLALDAVCCAIIGVDPATVEHLRLAAERGFGPLDLAQIQVLGDVSLDEARERAQGFEVGLVRVEDYFADTNIRAYAGPPPSQGASDYCWGGCPGALEEAIEILRVFDARTDSRMPKTHVVFGAYEGELRDWQPGERVIFLGDCASFHGRLGARQVDLESVYRDRSQLSPHEARHDDVFVKMAKVYHRFARARGEDVMVVRGCPVSVAESVLVLVKQGHLRNPIFDPEYSFGFINCYLSWRTRQAIQRLFGVGYQQAGPTARGAARPRQNLPPAGAATPLE